MTTKISDDDALKALIAEKKASMEAAALVPVKQEFEAVWAARLDKFDAEQKTARAALMALKEYQRNAGYDLTAEVPKVEPKSEYYE